MAMTTSQKNRARDNAPRIGQAQKAVADHWVTPVLVVIVFFGLLGLIIGAIEHSL